jgi:pyruvate kinase
MGADWVALSFVQRREDIKEMRDLVAGRANVMAKLEKPSVVDCLTEIVELFDRIMVAPADLGVEMRPETVPVVQRRILRACRKAGKPVIVATHKPVVVATQLLESMINTERRHGQKRLMSRRRLRRLRRCDVFGGIRLGSVSTGSCAVHGSHHI